MMIGTVLYVPLCILFIHGLDLGVEGLPLANGLKDVILLLTIYLYAKYSTET